MWWLLACMADSRKLIPAGGKVNRLQCAARNGFSSNKGSANRDRGEGCNPISQVCEQPRRELVLYAMRAGTGHDERHTLGPPHFEPSENTMTDRFEA